MEFLHFTATLPRGSGQWTSCFWLPRCLGAVDSGTPVGHCRTTLGQWAMDLLLPAAPLSRGCGLRAAHCHSGQWNSCITPSHFLGAARSGSPAACCLIAWGQRAVELLPCNAVLPGGSGQWNFCCTLLHRLGQWAVDILLHIALLSRGSGQWNSCITPPHPLLAAGSGSRAACCLTASGQRAVADLLHTASLPGGNGQWISCCTPPHSLGSGQLNPCFTLAHVAAGNASPPWGNGRRISCNTVPHSLGAVGCGALAIYRRLAWGSPAEHCWIA